MRRAPTTPVFLAQDNVSAVTGQTLLGGKNQNMSKVIKLWPLTDGVRIQSELKAVEG